MLSHAACADAFISASSSSLTPVIRGSRGTRPVGSIVRLCAGGPLGGSIGRCRAAGSAVGGSGLVVDCCAGGIGDGITGGGGVPAGIDFAGGGPLGGAGWVVDC